VIYERRLGIYQNGAFLLKESDADQRTFLYAVDGSYGDYTTRIRLAEDRIDVSCSCPYPGNGCKHAVAALLDVRDIVRSWKSVVESQPVDAAGKETCLNEDEIRRQALEDRLKRAQNETFKVVEGEIYKGRHLLQTDGGRQYVVTLHDPAEGRGHCSCPDYAGNRLGTCKHLIYLAAYLRRKREFRKRLSKERFPFFDIYRDSVHDRPRLFCERRAESRNGLGKLLATHFDEKGLFKKNTLAAFVPLLDEFKSFKAVRVSATVMGRLELLQEKQLEELAREVPPPPPSAVPSEELPEDTPHFMNSEALKSANEGFIDVTAEEDAAAAPPEAQETALVASHPPAVGPEKMEEVLNSGVAYIGGLLEMATGRKLEASAPDGRMLHVDPASGEVTLKFKLPGFGSSIPG
jgi:hypothetical protein